MNIYLPSYGLDTRYQNYMNSYQDIIKVLKDKKVAIIPNAKLISEDRTNSKVAMEELKRNGIWSAIFDLDSEKLDLDNYDALYLSGGKPKYLLNSIYDNDLFDYIKKFIDNGGIVIGQSAGAMIFSKNYYDTTTGKILIQSNGYDYCDKMIVPQFENFPLKIKKKYKKTYSKYTIAIA